MSDGNLLDDLPFISRITVEPTATFYLAHDTTQTFTVHGGGSVPWLTIRCGSSCVRVCGERNVELRYTPEGIDVSVEGFNYTVFLTATQGQS